MIPLSAFMYYLGECISFILVGFYSGVFLSMSMGTMTLFVTGIHVRITMINACIRQTEHQFDKVLAFKKLSQLNDCYKLLIKEIDKVNSLMGLQTVLSYGLIYAYTLFTSFTVYKTLLDSEAFSNQVIFNILFCSYLNFYSLSMIAGCSMCTTEYNKMVKLLNGITKRCTNPAHKYILMSYAKEVRRNPPIFTCGLLDFNWILLFSVRSNRLQTN